MSVRSSWLRWVGWGIVVLSLLFIGGALWVSASQLRNVEWQQFFRPGMWGLLLYGVSLALQALVWTGLASRLSLSPWTWWDVQVYCATHLTRRLPGLPWYIPGRAIVYKRKGRSGEGALVAGLLEWGGMLAAAGVWVVLGRLGWIATVLMLIGAAALLMIAYLVLLKVPYDGRWKLLVNLSPVWFLLAGCSYVFAWFLGGAIMYLLALPLAASRIPLIDVVALWALGGGVSMVMVFVPAGMGVREVTLSLLLKPLVGGASALVIALLMRVLFLVGDLIWGGVFWLSARFLGLHGR